MSNRVLDALLLEYSTFLGSETNLATSTQKAYTIDAAIFLYSLAPQVPDTQSLLFRITTIDAPECERIIHSISGYSSATQNRRMNGLKAFFRFLTHNCYVQHTPFLSHPSNTHDSSASKRETTTYISPDHLELLIASAVVQSSRPFTEKRAVAFLRTAYETGIRESYFRTLEWRNVHFGECTLGPLSAYPVIHQLSTRAIDSLAVYQDETKKRFTEDQTYVWMNLDGAIPSTRDFRRKIRQFGKLVGMPGLNMNSFRASYACNYLREHPDDQKGLQRMLHLTEGHALRYVRIFKQLE